MITFISGFLFNRFSFFLVALLVIAALVFFGKLVWNKFVIGGLVLLALCIGLWTYHDKLIKDDRTATAAPYIKLIDDNNKAAEKKLADETDRVNATNKQLTFALALQEKNDVTNDQVITILADKLHATRLRDPYQTRGCSSGAQSPNPANTQSSAGDGAGTGGELSTEFDGFLKLRFLQADKINTAYASCRAQLYKIREAMIAQNDEGGIVLAMSGELTTRE
jgi:hypothetical protein